MGFFNQMRTLRRRDIFVDLSGVATITADAIAVLLATVKHLEAGGKVNVSGNYPSTQLAQETIMASGFNDFLRTSMPRTGSVRGAIVRQDLWFGSKKANGGIARQLIDFAVGPVQSSETHNTNRMRLKASYGHLLECMGNTHEHASRRPGETMWWASVYRDAAKNRDCFTFIDMGVGIFNSVQMSLRRRVMNLTGQRSAILRDLLAGKIPSSTGKSYRGRGLPSIYRSAQQGKISRFIMLTNDVYADTERNDFRALNTELRGVVLYWEVRHAN